MSIKRGNKMDSNRSIWFRCCLMLHWCVSEVNNGPGYITSTSPSSPRRKVFDCISKKEHWSKSFIVVLKTLMLNMKLCLKTAKPTQLDYFCKWILKLLTNKDIIKRSNSCPTVRANTLHDGPVIRTAHGQQAGPGTDPSTGATRTGGAGSSSAA